MSRVLDDDDDAPGADLVTAAQYAPYITVELPNEKRVKVPTDSQSNKAANQVTVALMRDALEKKLATIKPEDMPVRDLKSLADSLVSLIEVSAVVYDDEGGGIAGRMADKLLKTAATGMLNRMDKMSKLGARKDEPKPVTEIDGKP